MKSMEFFGPGVTSQHLSGNGCNVPVLSAAGKEPLAVDCLVRLSRLQQGFLEGVRQVRGQTATLVGRSKSRVYGQVP